MPVVMTRCPKTNVAIGIGPSIPQEMFDTMILEEDLIIECTSCGEHHTIKQADLYLGKK